MHLSFVSAILAVTGGVSAASIAQRQTKPAAPALPVSAFNTTPFKGLTLEQLKALPAPPTTPQPAAEEKLSFGIAATCSNPRTRTEWDRYSTADRQNFVNSVKCLINAPSKTGRRNRYEDIVGLHQDVTPNVHSPDNRFLNAKFLIWHRYYLWVFEDIMRAECGFTANLPWFDERNYAGRFGSSSLFSNAWLGPLGLGGGCVTTGQFAGLTLGVGPGTANQLHCLSRNGDASITALTNSDMVNTCNGRTTYSSMAACAEGSVHAWGHNGVGAVMRDVYASPGDPFFWLHHAFVDRNFRVWQNADSQRTKVIDGLDRSGAALTMNTRVYSNGLRPDVPISEIMDTLGTKLCYKYDY